MQEKHLTKVNTIYWLKKKILNMLGIEGTYLNIVKTKYENPTFNITFFGENWKLFL